jgi:hypothetical protein
VLTIKQIARKLGDTEGTEILEAAIVLPLVFLLLLGIVEFGRVFNIYSTIQQAAQQGAITAARATCGTCPSGNTFPSDALVDTAISGVLQASNLSLSSIPLNSSPPAPISCVAPPALAACTNTGNITICRNALLNPPISSGQPSQCGTVVGFQYPFTFNLPFSSLNVQTITMSAQAQSRMEN